jgi:hypothetical protein
LERTLHSTGDCLEGHDLAASRLWAFRDQNREFVATLLAEGMLDGIILVERIWWLPCEYDVRRRLVKWTDLTMREL